MRITLLPAHTLSHGTSPGLTGLLAALILLPLCLGAGTPRLERIVVSRDGSGFVQERSGASFVPWGFNYDRDYRGRLLEDYWHAEWSTVVSDFAEMKQLGANVVRIHLQFGRFMRTATAPNRAELRQLHKLLHLAEKTGLHLDLTGLGCYHKADVPAWYDALSTSNRWAAQARFWEAVANTCAGHPAVFCYDLMNEPLAPVEEPAAEWLAKPLGDKHYVQRIALQTGGQTREDMAAAWTRQLTRAIRTEDPRTLVTIGLLPWGLKLPGALYSGFDPARLAPELDFLCVHLYPEQGKVAEELDTLQAFAVGKPVVIEEFFPMKCDMEQFDAFLLGSRAQARGWIGFYWGQPPDELRPSKRIADQITRVWLEYFQKARPQFLPDALPPRQLSGIYPHLATSNDEPECGTGAVVPWADRLWVISYGPHSPFGSSDKLYEITPDLRQIIRPESVGGTPANRMIHRESGQLLIGAYLIDTNRHLRVIPPARMPGRLTGNARHLTDPAHKVYYATMEEGLYEVDVRSLEVTGLIRDGNPAKPGQTDELHPAHLVSQLPGYHGKGLYSGQGQLIYANNGERSPEALTNPVISSGALATWPGRGDWQLVRRNQFTEVTGPGGLIGNPHPDTDPVWSIGWDARSLILMTLENGRWQACRLPKASHCYDGAHGWNTEWPRIRDIGEDDLLMTMHGMFWRFPRTFTPARATGIAPHSAYLKVIGDFCRWQDRLVFGCDDTARSEFLNKRKAKGGIAGPAKSQSNLWFVEPDRLDSFGPALGRGAVWLRDPVSARTPSEPFLFSGFDHRALHLAHTEAQPVIFTLEIDRRGRGDWTLLRTIPVPAGGAVWTAFKPSEKGAWIRLRTDRDCASATAFFQYRNADRRQPEADRIFAGLARPGDVAISGGLLHAHGSGSPTLRCLAWGTSASPACYDLEGTLEMRLAPETNAASWMRQNLAIPTNVLTVDDASVLYVDDQGRWRLPKGDPALDQPGPLGPERLCREVCTERDLFNAHGTFYELPADNAGGLAKIRPVATHNRRIHDYASYRGLLVLTGVAASAPTNNPHLLRSADGTCVLWAGTVDDLWRLGKPRGTGGPWKNTRVQAGAPSDPYLMTGYDRKTLTLSHGSTAPVSVDVQVDISGTGQWVSYQRFAVTPGRDVRHRFPDAFGAYWIRFVADQSTTATATLVYE